MYRLTSRRISSWKRNRSTQILLPTKVRILLEVYIETPFIFVLLIELIKLDTERDRCKWDDKGHRFISNDHFPPTFLVACPSVGIISILPAPIIVCRDMNWHGSHITLSHCPETNCLWLCIAYWENNLNLNRHIHGSFHYRPFRPALWAVCNGVSQNLA